MNSTSNSNFLFDGKSNLVKANKPCDECGCEWVFPKTLVCYDCNSDKNPDDNGSASIRKKSEFLLSVFKEGRERQEIESDEAYYNNLMKEVPRHERC